MSFDDATVSNPTVRQSHDCLYVNRVLIGNDDSVVQSSQHTKDALKIGNFLYASVVRLLE